MTYYEPIRSIYAPDSGAPWYRKPILGGSPAMVQYGHFHWPSRSYWLVPNTDGTELLYRELTVQP